MSQTQCEETVSILHAMLFGADGACVMLSVTSIMIALVPFLLGVLILQWMARKLWAGIKGPQSPQEPKKKTGPFDIEYDGGPIKPG